MTTQFLAQTQQQRQLMVLAPQLRQSLEFLQDKSLSLNCARWFSRRCSKAPTLEEKLPQTDKVEVESGNDEPEDIKELDFKEEFKVLARLDDRMARILSANSNT